MARRPTFPHAFARMALLAMLALSLVLQPVLAAIGETHELSHAAAMQADGHVVDQHDHDGQVSDSALFGLLRDDWRSRHHHR